MKIDLKDDYMTTDLNDHLRVNEFNKSLGNHGEYNPLFDPYIIYLEDVHRKVVWSTFFHCFFDFFKAFDKLKRSLCLIAIVIFVSSYMDAFPSI